jgi:signal transduction histidine kinase
MTKRARIESQNESTGSGSGEKLERELEVFRALKPYIGRCLTMNHDLNNPLTGILGYAEFMLMDASNLSDDQKSNLEQILRCAERMKEVVEGLSRLKSSAGSGLDLQEITDAYDAVPDCSD